MTSPVSTSGASSETSDSRKTQQKRATGGRGRRKQASKSPGPGSKNGVGNGSKSEFTESRKANKAPKDFRFLEIVKLVRKHFPITVNGYSVKKILESSQIVNNAATSDDTKTIKSLSKKAKESTVIDHIQNVLQRDPQQPIYLSFIMKPVDPDFPFELESLNFSLTIPAEYPRGAKSVPSIVVLNSEIPRGFSVNIERGFRTIANLAKSPRKTPSEEEGIQLVDGKGLLSQIQTLHKYLELFLQQEKRSTMKFVTFKNSKKASNLPTPVSTPTPSSTPQPQEKLDFVAAAFEDDQATITEATRLKREFYIGEMTQKLGSSVKLFNRSKSEARYKIQIPIVSDLNMPKLWLYGNKALDIFVTVPSSYPEVPMRAIVASNFSSNLLVAKKNALVGEGFDLLQLVEEARKAEKHFNKNVSKFPVEHPKGIVQQLNWISNHLEVLVTSEEQCRQWYAKMHTLRDLSI